MEKHELESSETLDSSNALDKCENSMNTEIVSSQNFDWQKIRYEGMYPCDRCEYKTTFLHNLKAHILSKHEGTKFECAECLNTFSSQSNLIRHRRAVHIVV